MGSFLPPSQAAQETSSDTRVLVFNSVVYERQDMFGKPVTSQSLAPAFFTTEAAAVLRELEGFPCAKSDGAVGDHPDL